MSSIKLPIPDPGILGRAAAIARDLRKIVPGEGVVTNPEAKKAFETDGLTGYRQMPLVVVLPETTQQVGWDHELPDQ